MKGGKISNQQCSLCSKFFYYENGHFLFSQPPLSIFWCQDPHFLLLFFFLFACMVTLAKQAYQLCCRFIPSLFCLLCTSASHRMRNHWCTLGYQSIPIMDYMAMLHLKGVPFSGQRSAQDVQLYILTLLAFSVICKLWKFNPQPTVYGIPQEGLDESLKFNSCPGGIFSELKLPATMSDTWQSIFNTLSSTFYYKGIFNFSCYLNLFLGGVGLYVAK